MGSTVDTKFFMSMRDIESSLLDGPTPTRATPINHRLGRDGWDLRNNIWQTDSRLLEFITGDDRQSAFQTKSNKVATADMSKAVTGASTIGNHNTSTGTANLSQLRPEPTSFTSRPMSALISPTRLRSNGILGADTSTTMTSLGQSSLLPGSAPDVEPSNQPSSQSTFSNHQGSTIGRSFRRFNVEDAEEFVPSCLQNRPRYPNRMSRSDKDDSLYFSERPTDANTPVSSYSQGQYLSDQRDESNGDFFPSRSINHLRRADSRADVMQQDSLQATSTTTRGTISHAQPFLFQDRWVIMQNEADAHIGPNMPPQYKHSGLRPDVASYRPSNQGTNVPVHISQQSSSGYGYTSTASPAVEHSHFYSNATNQQAVFANSHPYNNGTVVRSDTFHAHRNANRQSQQATLQPNALKFESNASGLRGHGSVPPQTITRRGTVFEPGTRMSHENGASQNYTASNPNPYASPHYDFLPGVSRSGPYHQPHGLDAANTATLNYYSDSTYTQDTDQNNVVRSDLLEEFRLHHKSRKYELKDIYGYIVEFSGDQTGSRFIQTKLEQANSDEKEQIFSELQTNARQLMSDVFGNYVIQKMFEYGNQSQKKTLASHMQGYVLKLSLQPYGCRCVQKAFEHILSEQQALLIKELEGHAIAVVESQHGNHVIQKAIECISGEHIQFIVDAHKNQVVRLSKHPYGCRIVQRMLEYCAPHAKRAILDEIQPAIPQLIDDQFGNYVIQCIIKKCGPSDKYRVIDHVQQRLMYYSTHKFASNVVEKAIQFAEESQRVVMVRQLTGADPSIGMQSPVLPLLKDQYGNYVMQTVLRTIQGPAKTALADEVRHHLNCIGKVSRGRQVTAMADTLNAITAGHSPSSISTGPQTPRTPTSLASGGSVGTPVTKAIEMVPPGYAMRDSQRSVISFGQFQV